jgi:hypothetical protein
MDPHFGPPIWTPYSIYDGHLQIYDGHLQIYDGHLQINDGHLQIYDGHLQDAGNAQICAGFS